jgi:hypothetical protein
MAANYPVANYLLKSIAICYLLNCNLVLYRREPSAHADFSRLYNHCWHPGMKPEIIKDGPVDPREIENLRVVVGWDRCEGTYEHILPRRYAYYIARGDDNGLVGGMCRCSATESRTPSCSI